VARSDGVARWRRDHGLEASSTEWEVARSCGVARGVSGGGTVVLLWHGVAVPLFQFDTAGIL